MKKFVSLLLALTLVLSMTANTFAASVTPSVDKTLVHAGETVNVTLTLDEAITDTLTIAYKLYFDNNLFEATSCQTGTDVPTVTMSKVKTKNNRTYVNLSTMDTTSQGQTLPAGEFCTVTFTAKADVTEQDAQFEVEKESLMLKDFTQPDNGNAAEGKGTISVTVKPQEQAGYTASLTPATQSVTYGDDAAVVVSVGATGYESFNSLDVTLTYDSSKLSFNKEASTIDSAYTVSDNAGTLRIAGYGEDKTLGEAFKLAFTTKAMGEAAVTLTAAKIDEKTNAVQDAPAAGIENAEAKITVTGYSVTLPADFEGAATVNPGEDYTFTAKDTHYDFTFTGSTMGGATAEIVDNGDGSYTVKNVTGNLVITTSKKTAKKYSISRAGSAKWAIAVASYANYGTDEEIGLNDLETDNYDYKLTVTINGQEVTPTLVYDTGSSRLYKIKGEDIVGPIVITLEETEKAPTTTSITFSGEGSADVKGGTTQTATNGQDFTFELNAATGYDYTVKLGDEELTAVEGKYTIPAAKLTGEALTVTVEKTPQQTLEINASEYVKLDGTTIWLVTAAGTVSEGKTLAYDGTPMFWSEKYEAYAYLVISDKTLADVKTEAETKIAEASASKTSITYDFDVNETSLVDINDAQVVYNMYNARYTSFNDVAMVRFLKADCNGDKVLSVLDANAVVAEIVK